MKICTLILAAGASARLGRPKQLLKKEGKSLLQISIEIALEAAVFPVYVVLGANMPAVKTSVQHLPVQIVAHQHWQQGIGSSIARGMEYLQQQDQYDGVLIMLCDQPLLTAKHLTDLAVYFNKGAASIVATAYAGHAGVPAVFGKQFYKELEALSGDVGARSIIKKNTDYLEKITFEAASIDIDTADDAQKAGLD